MIDKILKFLFPGSIVIKVKPPAVIWEEDDLPAEAQRTWENVNDAYGRD